ncbi:MAG: alkaline phosphatase family protein [Bacteroidaceae bacterium]|nr:alkaline phosphatase family protein [Bacteroidaceae bacterium]
MLFAFLFALMGAEAQKAPEVPRLVVNVVIDQLRTDYMEAFSPLYGDKGFHRLMGQGRVYSQAEYPFANPDRASAVACLMTGATPYENGIVGERWLDRSTLLTVGCVDDDEQTGYYTTDKVSPVNLGVSTITDELKVSTEGKALIYAVAPERDAAIFMGGHAANGAFWMDDETGFWCSTSYYGGYPSWLTYYNKSSHAAQRIDQIVWNPSDDFVGEFNYFVSGGTKKPFRHPFKGDRRFRQFKASALMNEEVNDFVSHCLQNTLMGVDAVTDFLSVSYYAGNYDHKTVAECPMELQDTYVRLDAQLGRLIDMVEQKVGRERVLFVVTGTGYSDTEQTDADLSRYRIPSGDFYISRAQWLLNTYLSAVYGQGQYVEACLGNQFYFDLKLIENKGLNLGEMLERSADFLIQLSGVRDVYTSQRLAQGAWTPGIRSLRNAYNPKCSGDILVQVAPGWRLVNEQTHERIPQRDSYMGFPLYLYGLDIKAEVIKTPVSVEHIAPTLAQCMRIRAPNGCSASPLTGIR